MRRVFWLNIAKSGVYLRYRHCFKLFRELRKESEFRQWCCQNSTKVWERKRKSGREKILNFGNHVIEISAAQTSWPSGVWSVNCPKRNQLWKCHCRNRGVKKNFVVIVEMPLPKMGEKKILVAKIWWEIKKKSATSTIFLQHFYNKSQVISYY